MPTLKELFSGLRPRRYGRKPHLVLLNGLAEQHESWFRNAKHWARYFEVHKPNILAYEGDAFHKRINDGLPISVDYLVEQLKLYLDQFVQNPPYHLVSSSLGGKVAVEFAVRYPELVGRVVLICPSGMGDVEQLPIMEGVRHNDHESLVRSVFNSTRNLEKGLLKYYRRMFSSKKWKKGFIRTVKGTNDHSVREQLKLLKPMTLFVSGELDRIVDPKEGARAAQEIPKGQYIEIPNCGHAPQIEKSAYINRLVIHFLTHPRPNCKQTMLQLLIKKPSRVHS
ncbi:alpha/beta hydrolase [Telmatocola sphagniphila]|uniref:Alpha/beta hydrolase n=1 Tax=Telmatocola sphagniphila TaxID=1123043 RepID=A0A8E6BAJ5_9BACT|nr:alpha/beta hydrolase [Telmatocola sphagniphila]QVL34798.1 alpha/beta hydrolase [Telmatocola sphagniphila]